jgi:hypothetical protein
MFDLRSPRTALAGAVLLLALAPVTARAQQRAADTWGRAFELRDKLAEPIFFQGIDDAKATLADALFDYLAKRYGLTFEVNEKAFKDDKIEGGVLKAEIAVPNPIPPVNGSLATVLKKILARVPSESPAVYVIRRDHIEVTTLKAVRAEFYPGRAEGDDPPLVLAFFDRAPLARALAQLGRQAEVNIVLDGRAGVAARTPVSADLANVPADTAAGVLADMAGLEVVRLDNVYYVTTPANARTLRDREAERKAGAKPAAKKAPEGDAKPVEKDAPGPEAKPGEAKGPGTDGKP